MRRQLAILRHAKSAWPEGVPDLRRPLAERGLRDAPAVGRWLRDHLGTPDAIACSPAERTRQTWALVATELDAPPPATIEDRVYESPAAGLLAVVRDLPDTAGTALVIGHNPGMEQLAELLTGRRLEMRTSSVAVLTWRGRWPDATTGAARLLAHVTPRG